MKIGYARVSSEDQNLGLQRDALTREGCEKIFEEKISGASPTRPVLESAIRCLRPGDVLVVWKLDRLGRSLQHLIKTIGKLEERDIGFRSVSDNIDTTTSSGKLMFHIVGAMAEFERSLISERTRAGMQAARDQGKHLGRPRSLSTQQIEHARLLARDENMTPGDIAAMMDVGRTTVWRALQL